MTSYCEKIYRTERWKSREVLIGAVGIGGNNPIRIQSMTTSDTRDVAKTLEQIARLESAGCEIVRVTVQGKKEVEACAEIKEALLKKGCMIPLVADIHFYPPAALEVAEFADKIRINPGNYCDKRASFKVVEYSSSEYAEELERLEEKFVPLVEKCKRLKRAIRIGANHGSLSDRIMNRYGDSPRGMVESALEFARICRAHNFHDMIFSMKASNTVVMIAAYRLLVAEMIRLGWDYPLHLGVTEAGEGEDGRVKSAVGIGSLLLDGLGDTLRVSLTEDPWLEIDPCRRLVQLAQNAQGKGIVEFEERGRPIDMLSRRAVVLPSYLHRDGSVLVEDPSSEKLKESSSSVLLERPYTLCEEESAWPALLKDNPDFVLFAPGSQPVHWGRKFVDWLKGHKLKIPVIWNFSYFCSVEDLVIRASADYGALLCDGLGEGILIGGSYPIELKRRLALAILQACRMRSTKTEFISCPGCGRTLFDLQQVAAKIRQRTAHLPGVKIAIMGCIVNGPGEMADADFGYVGSIPGKIDLYVGKTRVEKHIPMEDAEEKLVALIKQHNRWVEPQ